MDLKNIQTEVDTAFLYQKLAENEQDPSVVEVFLQMSEIEKSHALSFLEKAGLTSADMPLPSGRARILNRIGKIFGYNYVLGVVMDTEKSISSAVRSSRQKEGKSGSISDTAHVTILRNILDNNQGVSGTNLARFEKRHRSVGGNALRAAVLGGNDGLVSNFSLVMGVAGATSGHTEILLAGLAGLLAGALSMALGEWISVKSSLELYENQMQLEMEELETNPDGEEKELALIFQSKGVSTDQAKQMAKEIMGDKEKAHDMLVREELGIHKDDLSGSAMEAAITSFILFAVGAVIPVLPFFFLTGFAAILISTLASGLGLFLIGAAITLFTGKSIWFSGFRQVLFGLVAAAITFGIGSLIGVAMT